MIEIGDHKLYLGDSLDILPLPLVDSVITDPPYELGFMGKKWDSSGIAYSVELWRKVFESLKPGGHLLAFGGTRTHHRMVCAIEDAGFEIRDEIQWLYGSGMPKSLDVSKAIDKAAGAEREVVGSDTKARSTAGKSELLTMGAGVEYQTWDITAPATDAAKQWSGWGTALKPACEPICVARKPLIGTVAENVLKYGTGAINVDACRVGTEDKLGRWPANVIHDGSEEVMGLFPQTGGGKFSAPKARKRNNGLGLGSDNERFGTSQAPDNYGDSGSAARFFYCAKASKRERGTDNKHPTVKPLALMQYLVKLVTPPGGMVLDPFMGSGTTGLSCEGFKFIGIEKDPENFETARKRLQPELWGTNDLTSLSLD